MKQIAITVQDDQKAELLATLIASIDFVQSVNIQSELYTPTIDALDFYQDPRQAEMEKEVAAFEAQHPELVAHYLDQYIAMVHGKVVDHDREMFKLLDRVKASYPDTVVLVRQVQPTLPPPLQFRSPRFM